MTPRLLNLLTALGLAGLLAAVSLSAPHWAGVFRRTVEEPAPLVEPGTASPTPTPAAAATPGEAQSTIAVQLFFEAADRRGLAQEERAVPFSSDLPRQIRLVVEELLKGPQQAELRPVFDPATRVLEVFVTAGGIAYVDLSGESRQGNPGGVESEMLSVYALVNSVVENFPAVRRVQILVDDRPAQTLAGHVDLSRPLIADMSLLAPAPVEPAAPAAEDPLLPPPAPRRPPGP